MTRIAKPGEAHEQLKRLVGTWYGKEILPRSPWYPNGGAAIPTVKNQLALDGLVLVQEYQQERQDPTVFRGYGVFRWDGDAREYVLHWFDSTDRPPVELHGAFEQQVLTLTGRGTDGYHRAVFDVSESGWYRYRREVSDDGKNWQTVVQGECNPR